MKVAVPNGTCTCRNGFQDAIGSFYCAAFTAFCSRRIALASYIEQGRRRERINSRLTMCVCWDKHWPCSVHLLAAEVRMNGILALSHLLPSELCALQSENSDTNVRPGVACGQVIYYTI